MSRCHECKYYIQELDVNYVGCSKDMDEKYWESETDCPDFIDATGGHDDE